MFKKNTLLIILFSILVFGGGSLGIKFLAQNPSSEIPQQLQNDSTAIKASHKSNSNPNNSNDSLIEGADFQAIVSENINPNSESLVGESDLAKPHYDKGVILSIYGKHQRAIASFDRALSINPNFALGYYSRGISWEQSGNTTAAIQDFQKAISLAQKQVNTNLQQMAQQKLDSLSNNQ